MKSAGNHRLGKSGVRLVAFLGDGGLVVLRDLGLGYEEPYCVETDRGDAVAYLYSFSYHRALKSALAEFRERAGEDSSRETGVCRGCGCTDDRACDEGCSWIEPDLCSSCAPVAAEAAL